MDTDVIVIGSGPAACAAAISCSANRLNVLMVTGTKKQAPPSVQPSESVHPGVASVLQKLGSDSCIKEASRGIYYGIDVGGRLEPLGSDESGPWYGHHINRTVFDTALLRSAQELGVPVLHDAVDSIISSADRISGVRTGMGLTLTSRYVIDASGHKRVAAKQLGIKEEFHSPPLVVWTGISEGIPSSHSLFKEERALFKANPDGWTWLAPQQGGMCTWTRLGKQGTQEFLPPPELQKYPLTAKISKSNRRWRVCRPVCKEGLILCGDAAGIIDPAAGQGILNALVSGMVAANAIRSCISQPSFEALYLARYDEWFINDYMDKVNKLKHFYQEHGINIWS